MHRLHSKIWGTILLAALVALPGLGLGQEEAPVQPEPAPTGRSGMPFVYIPAGQYLRGFVRENDDGQAFQVVHRFSNSPETGAEEPAHLVKITRGFDISTLEVPVALFQRFVQQTGYVTDAEKTGGALGFVPEAEKWVDKYQKRPEFTWKSPGFEQGPNHPVVCVSWNDAQAFCKWLSQVEGAKIRLPTEAEWEYAARAGTETWYSWGNSADDAYAHANVADAALEARHEGMTSYQRAVRLAPGEGDGQVFTAPIGQFQPNPWGIHDMHGNVWEWCEDRFQDDIYKVQLKDVARTDWKKVGVTDPLQLEKTARHEHGDWRSMRGGAWNCAPANVRSSIRTFLEAGDAAAYTGFRIVRER